MIVGGILLFVIGAILAFGVNIAVPMPNVAFNFVTIGGILMVAGAILFIVGLVLRLRGSTTTQRTTIDPQSGSSVRQTRTDNDPPV